MNKLMITPLALLATSATLSAAEIDFTAEVMPIFREHCLECHGVDQQESNLRLDSMEGALAGGDSGERVIVPGNSQASYLLELVRSDDEAHRMPPDGSRLSPRQVEVLAKWIDDRSAWDAAQRAVSQRGSDHWSLQPLVCPPVPPSDSTSPIDAFILRKLRAAGLSMSPRAPKRRLIRRLYLVMHGLPPTPEQVQAFVEDDRDGAWERLVDDVLSSPRYGERLAMHWLDLVRFGETHGFETNRERQGAWRYRDWVIGSFNDDRGYDDFIVQQLAGDQTGEDLGTGFLVAGPHDLVKGKDPKLGLIQRQDELADMINATGTAFMGLTLGCARCHNHKFDPVTQTDYYSMQAVFAGVHHDQRKLPDSEPQQQRLADIHRQIDSLRSSLAKFHTDKQISPGQPNRPPVNAKHNVEEITPVQAKFVRMTVTATNQSQPCIDELEIFSAEQNVALASAGAKATSGGDFVHPLHKLPQIHDGRYGNSRSWIAKQRVGGWVQIELPQVTKINRIKWGRDRQGKYKDRLATQYDFQVSIDGAQWTTVASSADRIPAKSTRKEQPKYSFDLFPADQAERGRHQLDQLRQLEAEQKKLQAGTLAYIGTFSQPGPTHRLYRGEPEAKREEVSPGVIAAIGSLTLEKDSLERQRRLALANWIASPDHPLTARVMVNRLWHYHFGTGIVETPSDFGRNGQAPTHPELLDWLAAEFIDSRWSIKHLQRLILSSDAWQQDSRGDVDSIQVDAGSRLLWRFPPRRLEAEGIRDCVLAASGKLDRKMGGQGFSAFEVEMENVRHYHPKKEYGPEDWRRMIYMTKVRQERDAVFGVFDCPDGSQVTPKRSRSTTPLQALNLMNSRFIMQQAEFMAQRLRSETELVAEQIRLAYELCFGRLPDQQELAASARFIDQHGLVQFSRVLFNANEFLFIP